MESRYTTSNRWRKIQAAYALDKFVALVTLGWADALER